MQCYACGDEDVHIVIRPHNKAWGSEFPMCASCYGVFNLALEISSTGWDDGSFDEDEAGELFPCYNCGVPFGEEHLRYLGDVIVAAEGSLARVCQGCLDDLEVE